MSNELFNVLRAPHVSEKTARAQAESNQYVFKVATSANKGQIARAVEKMFEVTVENVRTVNVKGKSRSFRFRPGRRPDWKKAYVRVAEGQSIDVMEFE